MTSLLKLLSLIIVAIIFIGCGNSISDVFTKHKSMTLAQAPELIKGTAVSVTLQIDLMNIFVSLPDIYNVHSNSYTYNCSNGGIIEYAFSDGIFPLTLTYDECDETVSGYNGATKSSLKSGTIYFDGNSTDANVTFKEDFEYTVMGGEQLLVRASSAVNIIKDYSTNPWYYGISNLQIFVDDKIFHTIDLSTHIQMDEDAFRVTQNSGLVELNAGTQLLPQKFVRKSTLQERVVLFSIHLTPTADYLAGALLYYDINNDDYGVSTTIEINQLSVFGKVEDVTDYLWHLTPTEIIVEN